MQKVLFQRQESYFKIIAIIALIPNQSGSPLFLGRQKYLVTVTNWMLNAMLQGKLAPGCALPLPSQALSPHPPRQLQGGISILLRNSI